MTQYLEKTLRILQELLSEPSFPTEELELSIVAERQQYLVQQDKVAVLARNKFMEAIYGPQHAYGRKVKLADFDGVKRNHLINFFKSNYGMENCTIFIAGGMDEHLLKQVNQTLGQIPQHSQAELQKPALLEEPALQKRHFLRKEDAMQNAIRMGRPLFNQKHKDYAELSVLCTVLGGYFGSRLMKNIREEKGYTYGIYASIYPFQASGYFFIASEVGVSVASDALSEIYSELKTLREQPIPDEELHTVKRYLSGSLLRKMDGPFAQLERFKELYINDLAPDFYSHFIQQIEGANAKRLQELAQTYFQPEDLYEVVAGEQATAF